MSNFACPKCGRVWVVTPGGDYIEKCTCTNNKAERRFIDFYHSKKTENKTPRNPGKTQTLREEFTENYCRVIDLYLSPKTSITFKNLDCATEVLEWVEQKVSEAFNDGREFAFLQSVDAHLRLDELGTSYRELKDIYDVQDDND